MKIVIDMKLKNWNNIINANRKNKFMANKMKQDEMTAIAYYLLKVPKIKKYPIKLKCKWHIKNVNSDLDNKSLKRSIRYNAKNGNIRK